MRKKFLVLSLPFAILSAENALAVTCPSGQQCMSCGDDCLAYLTIVDDQTGTKQLNIIGTGDMTDYSRANIDRAQHTPWASEISSITSVVVADGITSIGSGALVTASSLTNIELPNTIESIGSNAFFMTGLGGVKVFAPDNLTEIGYMAFSSVGNVSSSSSSSSSPRVRFYCKDTETRSCTSISNDSYTWVTIWTYTLEDGVYCYNSYCYTSGEEMLAGSSSSCGDAATCQRVIEEREAGNCVSLSDCQTYIAEHPQTQTSEGGVEPVGGDEPAGGNESQGSAEPEGNEDPETNNNEAQENGTTDVSQMPSESQTPIATANANRDIKRIYTVEEASAVSKPTGNTFRLRYK